ncbi:MAG: CPXCG motif-containing cysteine-rich protein [Verrucomicrobiota bacterium]|nr:CPXCG motif-containing cysteine-rich protein [Verrucomicrobiota bacterium]
MEEIAAIQCPFCGQSFEVAVDTSLPFQNFVTDCEVCCRPVEVNLECTPGRILRLNVVAG